ncbi:GHMP family kinase ATP-binding protein [[Mycoplasma] imitans]|uniref:GHMP family kinase ATP-binding protein n=1 Tax=[Mycoplasma] imitans TaxID=29560 RepID=UPI000685AF5D|nr:4-diphosphocytidyl-2C-methyl-D-erythritol synthase [[Mycoplasma] imitans]
MNHYRSYAKVNFYLKIKEYSQEVKKHKLESKLILVKDLYDDLYLERSDHTRVDYLDINNNHLSFSDDILIRTKRYLENKLNQTFDFKAKVIKKIPTLSGLGSAPSNAGVLINWIYQEFGIISQISLYDIATELGSDIPFFLSSYDCAIISNFGDVVQQSSLEGYQIDKIIFNKQKPSTKKIFELLDYSQIKRENLNDLEEPFFSLFPELLPTFNQLKNKNNIVLLAGAGSSFVIFRKLNKI